MVLAAVALAALSLAAAACSAASGGGTGPGASTGSPGPSPIPAANATAAPLLPTDAAALPDMDIDGYRELLGQLRGTPVLVNIWGSWCGPCREEAPLLATAHARYGDRVQFLGIDILDAPESARGFIEEFRWTYPSVLDPSAGGDIRNQLGYLGQPVTLFYDTDGELVADWEGPMDRRILETNLRRILPQDASGTDTSVSTGPSPCCSPTPGST